MQWQGLTGGVNQNAYMHFPKLHVCRQRNCFVFSVAARIQVMNKLVELRPLAFSMGRMAFFGAGCCENFVEVVVVDAVSCKDF